jgi:hypothetical protein
MGHTRQPGLLTHRLECDILGICKHKPGGRPKLAGQEFKFRREFLQDLADLARILIVFAAFQPVGNNPLGCISACHGVARGHAGHNLLQFLVCIFVEQGGFFVDTFTSLQKPATNPSTTKTAAKSPLLATFI